MIKNTQDSPSLNGVPTPPINQNLNYLKTAGLILILVIVFFAISSRSPKNQTPTPPLTDPKVLSATQDSTACAVAKLEKSELNGIKIFSPNGDTYILNKEDGSGVPQIYSGKKDSQELTCITCSQTSGGPAPQRAKMQPTWHPSGQWIFLAVERDQYSAPAFLADNRAYIEGQLQNGIWTDMWAVTPDGKNWNKMTNFQSGVTGVADGYTGPAITPDGKKVVWSQIADGNIFAYWPFGRWELTMVDFSVVDGRPTFTNKKNITPSGMNWNEPGNFSSDNATLLFTGSTEKDAQGMDQYLLNIKTGRLKNLTNSPTVWDEHGMFSPNGKKIFFMSAYPYRSDANASKVLTIKTEFMLMNSDGSNLRQLTHFKTPGYEESSDGIAANGVWSPDGKTLSLRQLFFPNYQDWQLAFSGACGKN